MNVTRIVALLMLAATSACACALYDDSCGPEHRIEQTQSALRSSIGTDLGQAILMLVETRVSDTPRTVTVSLIGPGFGSHGGPLKGNVAAVLLTDGAVRLEIPVASPPLNGDEIIATAVIPINDDDMFSTLQQDLAAGKLRLHIETSSAAIVVNDVSFAATPLSEWHRAQCS